jgi:hypothetical protein
MSSASASIEPVALLRRAARLLWRFPARAGLAYAGVVLGLNAGLLLHLTLGVDPGPSNAAAASSTGASEAPFGLDVPASLNVATQNLPVNSFSPPTGSWRSVGRVVEHISGSVGAVEGSVQIFAPSMQGLAASLQVLAIAAGALLLAGPVLASAYAAVLPCVSDGEAEGLGSAGLKTSALLSAAGAYLVAEVGMAVGLVLLIVPGVVIGAGLAPLMPLIADRGLGPREALRSAWALTAGHRTRIMGLYALVWLAAFLASGLAYGLALAAPDWAAVAVFLAVGGGVGAWNLMARACLYRQLARLAAEDHR